MVEQKTGWWTASVGVPFGIDVQIGGTAIGGTAVSGGRFEGTADV